jgi:adenylate kinase family enzyme
MSRGEGDRLRLLLARLPLIGCRAYAAAVSRRILFLGVTGSGKTTLARAAADRIGVPFLEGDSVGWLPGWVHRDLVEQRAMVADIVAGEGWVIDSAWGAWRDLVLPRTELIVALDYPRVVSLGRLVRRTVRRNLTGEPVCNGNTETWRRTFGRDSIIAWHFRTFAEKRELMDLWEADPEAPPVLRLRTPGEAAGWLSRLPAPS